MVGNILIIGGTGTLGRAILDRIYHFSTCQVTILSRDEHKQQEMKRIYPKVRFVLGDIRDIDSIEHHFWAKDVVFHVAALKHIDHIEDNPVESIRTNVLGTINVSKAAIRASVPYCVFSSTDKAVDPINTYGYCKALSEKILLNMNQTQLTTLFSVYRWGNVINSKGSAIPFFVECLRKREMVPITDKAMTRFWITIDDAVEFILKTYKSDQARHEVLVHPEMRSAKVMDVIDTLAGLVDAKSYGTKYIGLRKGEKLHEALRSQHSESPVCSKSCTPYTRAELKELLRPLIDETTRK